MDPSQSQPAAAELGDAILKQTLDAGLAAFMMALGIPEADRRTLTLDDYRAFINRIAFYVGHVVNGLPEIPRRDNSTHFDAMLSTYGTLVNAVPEMVRSDAVLVDIFGEQFLTRVTTMPMGALVATLLPTIFQLGYGSSTQSFQQEDQNYVYAAMPNGNDEASNIPMNFRFDFVQIIPLDDDAQSRPPVPDIFQHITESESTDDEVIIISDTTDEEDNAHDDASIATLPQSPPVSTTPPPSLSLPLAEAAPPPTPTSSHTSAKRRRTETSNVATSANDNGDSSARQRSNDKYECNICYRTEGPFVALVPCGHVGCLSCCRSAMASTLTCFMCKTEATSSVRVYL
jgi:hypothetical protein